MDKIERNVGIDLLRIVSMIMVVTLHVLGKGGILSSADRLSANYNIAWLVEIAAYCAVNCYALISGYVGIKAKRKASGLISLWLQVVFYSFLITSILYFTHIDVNLKTLLTSLIPVTSQKYWYFTAYFAMWFFIPLMNAAINHLSKKEAAAALVSAGIFLIPIELRTGAFLMNGGYGVLWLSYLYLIGGYISKHNLFVDVSPKKPLIVYIACISITFIFKIGMVYLNRSGNLLVNYISPFILLSAISLLVLFFNLKISSKVSKIISTIAPLSFSVYLIHTHPLVFSHFFKGLFAFLASENPLILILGIIISVVVIFVICILIDCIRSWIFKKLKIRNLCSHMENKISLYFEQRFGSFCS